MQTFFILVVLVGLCLIWFDASPSDSMPAELTGHSRLALIAIKVGIIGFFLARYAP